MNDSVKLNDSPEPPAPRQREPVNLGARMSFAVALYAVGVAVLAWGWYGDRESARDHAHRIEQAQGIKVGYGAPADFWTPPYLPEDARSEGLEMRRAEVGNLAPALNGIEAALTEYPPGFLGKLVDGIFICGEIRVEGEKAGGLARYAWIILIAPSDHNAASVRWASVIAFHHELSSFVLESNATNYARWTEFAPANWNFARSAGEGLRRADSPAPAPEMGFLSAYGATTLENDFNVYAEKIFTEPAGLALLARQYPLIRRKLEFVRAAYVKVDPRIAERFRELGLDDVAISEVRR